MESITDVQIGDDGATATDAVAGGEAEQSNSDEWLSVGYASIC